jgi:hypothetical protein
VSDRQTAGRRKRSERLPEGLVGSVIGHESPLAVRRRDAAHLPQVA